MLFSEREEFAIWTAICEILAGFHVPTHTWSTGASVHLLTSTATCFRSVSGALGSTDLEAIQTIRASSSSFCLHWAHSSPKLVISNQQGHCSSRLLPSAAQTRLGRSRMNRNRTRRLHRQVPTCSQALVPEGSTIDTTEPRERLELGRRRERGSTSRTWGYPMRRGALCLSRKVR